MRLDRRNLLKALSAGVLAPLVPRLLKLTGGAPAPPVPLPVPVPPPPVIGELVYLDADGLSIFSRSMERVGRQHMIDIADLDIDTLLSPQAFGVWDGKGVTQFLDQPFELTPPETGTVAVRLKKFGGTVTVRDSDLQEDGSSLVRVDMGTDDADPRPDPDDDPWTGVVGFFKD